MKPKARRTKFEIYIDILKVLEKQPMKITHITHAVNINGAVAKEFLDFMCKQTLVAVQISTEFAGQRFVLTESGKQVLKYVEMIKGTTPPEIWCEQTVFYGGKGK